MLNIQGAFSGFSVNGLERTQEFYGQTLGLPVSSDNMGLQLSLPNGGEVFLYDKGDGHQPATYTVLNFVVDSIDDAVDELVKRGVTFERYANMPAPQDEKGIARGLSAGMGPDIAWFLDPSGNVLSVIQDK
jgi:catechol 2,3-dioxygenase-like lactoylglutathione lyase family enzyme